MPSGSGFFELPGISDEGFSRFRHLIAEQCGIRLAEHKKSMLEARLRKRLRSLGLDSFAAYQDYLFSREGMREELHRFIDAVTTNKTDFFREAAHFTFLTEEAVPRLVHTCGSGRIRPLRVWSAGCSTGEEPYTVAMVLAEYGAGHPDFHFSILGTDISTQVLETASQGIYRAERIEPIPPALRGKYLLRSRERERNLVRVVPELRAAVRFRRLNLIDEDYGIREPVDIIFCRNVLIYFEPPEQRKILSRLCRHLFPGRYLLLGHSETISGMGLPLEQLAPSVYRRV